jgi:hypothetical protein
MYTKFWSENLTVRDHPKDLGIDGNNIRMNLKVIGWEFGD